MKKSIIYFVSNYTITGINDYATIKDVKLYCDEQKELAIDIETSYKYKKDTFSNENIYKPGLDPFLSQIVMIQIGTKEKVFVIDVRCFNEKEIQSLFTNTKNTLYVMHNGRFEAKHLLHNYGILFHKIWDTMLVEMNLYNGLGWSKKNKDGYRFSLEALANRYLGVKSVQTTDLFNQDEEIDEDAVYIDKSTRMGFLTIGDKLFTETQILYGADDIVYPLKIKELQLKGTGSYNPRRVHNLENDFCLVLADIELKGVTFDKEQWLKNYEDNLVVYNHRKEKLDKYVEKKWPKYCELPDLFNPDNSGKCLIEWSSPNQVVQLFKDEGFCPKDKSKETGKQEYTVGAKSLSKLLPTAYKELYMEDKETDIVEQKDLILNYLLLKVSEQAVTTFGKEFLKYIHPITGRLHSEYRQILNTGRISSNKPNLQNIPADKGYRSAFIAPDNCKLINADYSAQESRILAELSGDEAMVSFFNEGHPVHGDDYHSFTATKMFSLMRNQPDLIVTKKTHPEERTAAKTISFKIAYGGSAYTLKDDFGVEEEVAQEFIDGYMSAFPALDNYFKNGREQVMKVGYIDMIPDRRYWEFAYKHMKSVSEKAWSYYPKDYSKMSKEKQAVVKKQINTEHPEIKKLWSEYFSIKGSLERCSQNYPIQSLAGAQTKLGAVLFRKYQIENNLRDKVWITNLIHDELLAECTEDYSEPARKLIEDSMIKGAQYYCKKVKMNAEAVICEKYWSH